MTEYGRRLDARRTAAQALARLERRISSARMAVFLAGVVVAVAAFDRHWLSPWWLGLPVVSFVALVLRHDAVIRARQRADRAVAFYERGVARIEDRWAGSGATGARFVDAAHPYAGDLDLFGDGSLFQLLSTARTRAGEAALAAWLKRPAPVAEVRARQVAVAELRPKLDLREELSLLGGDVEAGLHPEALAAWAAAPPLPVSRFGRSVAAVAVSAVIVSGVGWAAGLWGPWPLAAALAVEAGIGGWWRRRVQRVMHAVEQPVRDLTLLAQILARLEAEPCAAPRLLALRAALDTEGVSPSRRIAQLNRLVHLLDARRNELFGALAIFLLWATQCALAIEQWRMTCGPAVGRWLAVVGELEALSALAGYAYEHPADPFPEVVEAGPCFEAAGLGHPLIPAAHCVRNDLRLGGALRVLVVSGSNMSGKSTLLRSVGTAAVLALAGAPVRATRLRLSAVQVGASIRINDSLQTGTSHFYAEILRLRQLMEVARGEVPLLFLLDEILHGTNSHDRSIGAAAAMRGFIARGAIGLLTTHDLALAQVADGLAPQAANVHFEDQLVDGRMTFDYRMRPGVVQKSNAVALMRAVGLEV